MEGGMSVSKQIHLDEQACNVHLYYAQPFPHGVCARASWSLAVLLCIRVVGEDELAPRLPLTFCYF